MTDQLPDQGVRAYYCAGVVEEQGAEFHVRVILGTAADRLRVENERLDGAVAWLQSVVADARAENERLREALRGMLDVSGACHVVTEGPNARWVEYGDGDGYFDEDLIASPDCPVCPAEKRAKEVLGDSPAFDEGERSDA